MNNVHQLELGSTDEDYLRAKFEEFWTWYPLKKGKAKARALFMKITAQGGYSTRTLDKDSGAYLELHLEAIPDEIIEAAKAFYKTFPRKGGTDSSTYYTLDTTYCPHATTWLNQGRWED